MRPNILRPYERSEKHVREHSRSVHYTSQVISHILHIYKPSQVCEDFSPNLLSPRCKCASLSKMAPSERTDGYRNQFNAHRRYSHADVLSRPRSSPRKRHALPPMNHARHAAHIGLTPNIITRLSPRVLSASYAATDQYFASKSEWRAFHASLLRPSSSSAPSLTSSIALSITVSLFNRKLPVALRMTFPLSTFS